MVPIEDFRLADCRIGLFRREEVEDSRLLDDDDRDAFDLPRPIGSLKFVGSPASNPKCCRHISTSSAFFKYACGTSIPFELSKDRN